jgi:aurora kinase
MAPELVNRQPYNEKVDVWSLGIITYQLLVGRTPFEAETIK